MPDRLRDLPLPVRLRFHIRSLITETTRWSLGNHLFRHLSVERFHIRFCSPFEGGPTVPYPVLSHGRRTVHYPWVWIDLMWVSPGFPDRSHRPCEPTLLSTTTPAFLAREIEFCRFQNKGGFSV